MHDSNFNELFGNKFDEFEKNFQNINLKINIIDKNTNQKQEYDLYSLVLECKTTLETLYKSNLEKLYLTYKNFIYFFNQFLLEFKKHGINYSFKIKDFSSICPDYYLLEFSLGGFFYSLKIITDYLLKNPNENNNIVNEIISDQFSALIYTKNSIEKKSFDNFLSEDSVILTENDFARVAFSYSSYSALLDSVTTYIKSIYSGNPEKLLVYAASEMDPSDFFIMANSPFSTWPIGEAPATLNSFVKKSLFDMMDLEKQKNIINNPQIINSLYLEYFYFKKNTWISESGINLISSLMSSLSNGEPDETFNSVYIKIGDGYVGSINKDVNSLNKFLNILKLSENNFLSNEFFSTSLNKPIIDSIFKIILKQHEACYPVVSAIISSKIDAIKNKYIKGLNLSPEESDSIFKNIYEDFIYDNNLYRELAWNYFAMTRGYFDNNRTIVIQITQSNMLYLEKITDLDYLGLFKSCINYNNLFNFIKEKFILSDKEFSLSEVFLNYFDSILEKYSEKINNTYKNSNSNIYSDIDEYILTNKLQVKNLKNIKHNIRKNIETGSQDLVNQGVNPIDIKSIYKASLGLNIDSQLRAIMFASRLEILNNMSYKDFLNSEKKSIEEIEKETAENLEKLSNPDLKKSKLEILKIEEVIKNNNLINLVSKLIMDNFKKEGQLLQNNNQDLIQVKFPETSEEKKSDIYVPKDISFAKLSILLGALEVDYLYLPISFSEFLNDLKIKIKKSKKITNENYFASDIITSLALFWIKRLCKSEEVSSIESLNKVLLSFFENLPLLISILNSNETLKKSVLTNVPNTIKKMEDNFINQSKFSKIETFKNLSSLLRFYHNYEKLHGLSYMLAGSKNLNKLYLNNYQVFLKSFIDFNYLLNKDLNKDSMEIDDINVKNLTLLDLKNKIYSLKEEISSDPNFGPEKAEKLLPDSRIKEIIFFDLEFCDITPDSFDEAFDKMQGNFDPKRVSSIDNIISIIKQINDIKKYVVHSKPKNDIVLDNNYMFSGLNNSQFRFRTLGDIDPQHFSIGIETSCCQRIGGAGQAAAIDSFINPNASVIILEVNNGSGWSIISQSYFHVAPKEKYFILDNIEAGKYNNISLKSIIGFNFFEVYAILAQEILKKGFKKVLCGKGYTEVLNIDTSKFKTASIPKDPRHFEIGEESFMESNQGTEIYTDFRPDDCYDLGEPNFKVPEATGLVFTASSNSKNDLLLKISNSVLKKSINNINLIKLSNYLFSINLTNYSSRVLLLEK